MAAAITTTHHVSASGLEARTLDRLAGCAPDIDGVRIEDVNVGDWVVVRTRNSQYSIAPVGRGRYRVAGGWFATHSTGEEDVRIAGCTWGGTAIHTGLVAAVGMYLEFENGVRTTRIREVRVVRGGDLRPH